MTFTKIVPAAPPVARFGEVFVFFEIRSYMDHGKAIRVEIGGVPEAPDFFFKSDKFCPSFFENSTNFSKFVEFSKNSGASGQTRRGAPPPQSSRAADLVSKKSKDGQNPLGLGWAKRQQVVLHCIHAP